MKINFSQRLLSGFPTELRSNVSRYYLDISWWGLYGGATMAFLSIYATRIGATPAQIGLMTALPAAVQLLASLPFAGLVKRLSPHRANWTGAFLARLLFALYIFLPLLASRGVQVNAIILIGTLIAIPATLTGIAFNQLLMEAIPIDWRGTVVGVRNALYSIITFVVTVISGQILTHVPFPLNYQIVFAIGFIGAIMTAYQLWHVRPLKTLQGGTQPLEVGVGSPPASRLVIPWRSVVPRINAQGQRYMQVLALLFLFNTVNNMVAPLVPGILVNRLSLSDAWISIGTALNSMLLFLVSIYYTRGRLRSMYRQGTAVGAALLALQAVVLALASNEALYILSVVIGGLGAGILLTAQYNYHLENIPDHERAVWLSWNLLLGNAAVLIGSLGGPQLALLTGVPAGLVLFGVIRLVIGVLIFRRG